MEQLPTNTRGSSPFALSPPKEELWHSDTESVSVFGSASRSDPAFQCREDLGGEVENRYHLSVSNLLLMPPRSEEGERRVHDDDDSLVFGRGEEVEDCGEEREAAGAGGHRSEHHGSGVLAGDVVELAERDEGVVVVHSGIVRVEDSKEVGAVSDEAGAEANSSLSNLPI